MSASKECCPTYNELNSACSLWTLVHRPHQAPYSQWWPSVPYSLLVIRYNICNWLLFYDLADCGFCLMVLTLAILEAANGPHFL